MSKVVTLRLSDEEYSQILVAAESEHRPISNFITTSVLKEIAESYFTDSIETAQILSNKALLEKLKSAHRAASAKKGKFVA